MAAFIIFSLNSCNKEQEEEIIEEQYVLPPPIVYQVPGCYIQTMLASDLDMQYSFDYLDAYPTVLDSYKMYNSTTGNVNESYRFGYEFHEALQAALLDTVYRFIGDFEEMDENDWSTLTVFEYFFGADNEYYVDQANVYVYDSLANFNGLLIKGTIYYEYDLDGLLIGVDYVDFADNEVGTFYDNYHMVLTHDTEERLREIHYYNWNEVETYYEIHVPSPYYQPIQTSKSFHPEQGWLTRFAPAQSTYWTQGVGMVSYNYEYQVNDENYVVEQSWNDGANDYLISLYNYECYE